MNTNKIIKKCKYKLCLKSSLFKVAVADLEEEMGRSALGAANNLYKCKYKRNTNTK